MTKTPAEVAAEIDAAWDFDDPVASETRFREQLGEALRAADLERQTQLLTQIGRALGLQRRFDEAHAVLDDVESRLAATSPLARVRWQLERGRALNSDRNKTAARPLFDEAYRLASEHGHDFYAIDAAHMIAIVAEPDEAIAWNERAIAEAQAADDTRARGWRGSLCNNLGWTYHGRDDFARALELFEEALAARREQGKPEDIRVAEWCKARCLRSLGRLEEALEIQRRLATAHAEAGTEDGYVHEELAELLHALDRTAEARPHFKRAHELLSKDPWLVENEAQRLARLGAMGR